MLEAGFDEECRIGIQPHDLVAVLDFDPCSTGMREHLKMEWTLRLSSIESDIPLPYLEKWRNFGGAVSAISSRSADEI